MQSLIKLSAEAAQKELDECFSRIRELEVYVQNRHIEKVVVKAQLKALSIYLTKVNRWLNALKGFKCE